MKVVVSGASGFVASFLLPELMAAGHEVVAVARRPFTPPVGCGFRRSPDLGADADWSAALCGADAVVHLAGLAHVTASFRTRLSRDAYCRVNEEGTKALAAQAAAAGIRHFVFLSSCHAVAASSEQIVSRETAPRPVSDYGRSKLAAENALRSQIAGSECAWTILRPPAVYGREAKGNLGLLMRAVRSGWPLPVASAPNRRSYVGASNLADFIVRGCLGNPAAFEKIYYPADEEDLNTRRFIELFAKAAGRPERILPCPPTVLSALGGLPGMQGLQTLNASLFVDKRPSRDELGWTAPHSAESLFASTFSPAA